MSVAKEGYEFFDHTADIGIRAEATTLQALFVSMARGLTE
ncbi:MAG: archease [Candidatus Omnitrophica bacterium]|nr:archease [Candidatus Omnitrophota bacterium]